MILGKKNPETCFRYLPVCHSKTYNRNCHVRTFELIFQCFFHYLDFGSHGSQLLSITIILWLSGLPTRLVWDNPEPRNKRHKYISIPSYHLFSDLLILVKALVIVCILKCSKCLVAEVKSCYKTWKQKTM